MSHLQECRLCGCLGASHMQMNKMKRGGETVNQGGAATSRYVIAQRLSFPFPRLPVSSPRPSRRCREALIQSPTNHPNSRQRFALSETKKVLNFRQVAGIEAGKLSATCCGVFRAANRHSPGGTIRFPARQDQSPKVTTTTPFAATTPFPVFPSSSGATFLEWE